MSQRLNDLESTHKYNRAGRIAAVVGILICVALVSITASRGEWGFAGAYFLALMFALTNYFVYTSAEANVKTAIALHHENTALQRDIANAEEVKMYEIRDYNRKLMKCWENNK